MALELPSVVSGVEEEAEADRQHSRRKIFEVEMPFGTTIKQYVDFSRRVSRETPLVLSRLGISTAICSPARQLVSYASFRREDFSRYFLRGLEEDSEFRHVINIETADLLEALKTTKRGAIALWQFEDEPNAIHVNTSTGTTRLELRTYTPVHYRVAEGNRRPTYDPNASILATALSSAVSNLSRSRFGKLVLKVGERGVAISASRCEGGVVSHPTTIGKTRLPKTISEVVFGEVSGETFRCSLSSTTVIALAKALAFAKEGSVKFYTSPQSSVVRVEMQLGSIGNLRMFIVDTSR